MTSAPQTAREISEYLLERTGRALMSGDLALFESCIALPQHLESFDGRVYCETPEHFQTIFFSVVAHLRNSGVTQMIRHCVAAEFRDENTVEATHEARLLAGDQVVQPAYPVFSVLKRIDGVWKITYSMYAITEAPAYSQAVIMQAPGDDQSLALHES